jgi:hypothetical protein
MPEAFNDRRKDSAKRHDSAASEPQYFAEPANPAISDVLKCPKEPPTIASNAKLPVAVSRPLKSRRLPSRRVRGCPSKRQAGTAAAHTDGETNCTPSPSFALPDERRAGLASVSLASAAFLF